MKFVAVVALVAFVANVAVVANVSDTIGEAEGDHSIQ